VLLFQSIGMSAPPFLSRRKLYRRVAFGIRYGALIRKPFTCLARRDHVEGPLCVSPIPCRPCCLRFFRGPFHHRLCALRRSRRTLSSEPEINLRRESLLDWRNSRRRMWCMSNRGCLFEFAKTGGRLCGWDFALREAGSWTGGAATEHPTESSLPPLD
jgi:hypothetical protein